MPLLLQDHSDPVVYRNVWLQPVSTGSLTYTQEAPKSPEQLFGFPQQANQLLVVEGRPRP